MHEATHTASASLQGPDPSLACPCSPPLLLLLQYETEFDWAGTRIFVSTCIVEGWGARLVHAVSESLLHSCVLLEL